MQILNYKNRKELRDWFIKNKGEKTECYIYVNRSKELIDGITYLDALEEALCFGFIDSTCKKGKNGLCVQRFSKRAKNSIWTELNKARVKRLIKLGLMQKDGLDAYKKANKFFVEDFILREFEKNKLAYTNFLKFPKLYQKIKIDNIQRYKKNKSQCELRLKKLIENSEKNIMFGEWNDNGKLK